MRLPLTLLAALVVISLSGLTIFASATRWGIGLVPDSAAYIATADNLLSGRGLSMSFAAFPDSHEPMIHYPPGYSIALALGPLIGFSLIDWARLLSALTFMATTFSIGLIVHALTRSFWSPIFASSLFIFAPQMQFYLTAYSESLFIPAYLWSLFLLARYIEKQQRLTLFLSATSAGLAFITRYAGLGLVIPSLIILLRKRKRADAGLYFIVSCLPIALWLLRNLLLTETATTRQISFHPMTLIDIQNFVLRVSSWILPPATITSARWVALFAGTALLLIPIFMYRLTSHFPTLFTFCYGYLVFLILVQSLLDRTVPIWGQRELAPVYVSLLLLVSSQIANVSIYRKVLFLLAAAIFFGQAITGITNYLYFHDNGIDYAGRELKQSPLIRYVKTLDSKVRILTNAPDVIYLVANHSAHRLPTRPGHDILGLNHNYPQGLSSIKPDDETIIVYFNRFPNFRLPLFRYPSEQELTSVLKLNLILKAEDGSIYALRKDYGS